MKKILIYSLVVLFALSCENEVKVEKKTSKEGNSLTDFFSSSEKKPEIIFRDSILKVYNKKFPDYKFIQKWIKKNPPFLENAKGNLYKVLKKTTIKVDNSVVYEELTDLDINSYIFVHNHKNYLFFMEFEIIDNRVKLVSLTKINRGIMYEDKLNLVFDEKLIIKEENFTGRIKPFFNTFDKHLLFGYKSNKEGNHTRIYFDLGYDIYDEDLKDSVTEYLITTSQYNKTENKINEKMLCKI